MILRTAITTLALTGLLFLSASQPVRGQVPRAPLDEYGKMDTVSILVRQTGPVNWEAVVELSNDENVAALTLPLSWKPAGHAVMIDSATYDGMRTSYFALKTFFPDTTAGKVLIGMISDLGTGLPPLGPGRGAIARLHFTTSIEGQIPQIDTTFIRPHNVLQLVTPDVRAILPVFQIHNLTAESDAARH